MRMPFRFGASLYTKILGLAFAILALSLLANGVGFLQNSLLQHGGRLHQAKIAIEQMAQHEQAFITTRDTTYARLLRSTAQDYQSILQSDNDPALVALVETLREHMALFGKVEARLIERGLDENSGNEGKFRASVHAIEEVIDNSGLDDLKITMLSIRRSEKDFLLRLKDKYIDNVHKLADELAEQADASSLPEETRQLIAQQIADYRSNFDQTASIVKEIQSLAGDLAASHKSMETTLSELVDAVDTKAANRQTTTVAIIIFSLIAGVVLALWIARALTQPVRRLQKAAESVAAGNTDIVVEVQTNDEVGRLAESFNTMVGSISSSRRELEQRQQYLSDSVEHLLSTMNRFAAGDLTVQMEVQSDDAIGSLYKGFNNAVATMRTMLQKVAETIATAAATSQQITHSTEELSGSAHEQAAQAGQVAVAVEEMAQSSNENAQTSRRASELAHDHRKAAQESGTILQDTVEKIRTIADVVQSSVETIEKLSSSSARIGDIVSVIKDIADQTNLLALNAAIEAARAGEQGRGFAVVADEVRKLAEKSARASGEISAVIGTIQSEAQQAVVSMQRGSQEVAEGLQLTDGAGTALAAILNGSEETLRIVTQITSASEEQSTTTAEIAQTIDGMTGVIEQSASAIAEIATATDNLNRHMEELRILSQQFVFAQQEEARYERRFARRRTVERG